jgi:hypothetical protein
MGKTREQLVAEDEARAKQRALNQTGAAGTAARAADVAERVAAFNPGAGFSMPAAEIARRQAGGVIMQGAMQVAPDRNNGVYTAYDSRQHKASLSPTEIGRQAAFAQDVHQAEAAGSGGGIPNAPITLLSGQGYVVDPQRRLTPYADALRQRRNTVPVTVSSAPVALRPAPVAPVVPVAPVFNPNVDEGNPLAQDEDYRLPLPVKNSKTLVVSSTGGRVPWTPEAAASREPVWSETDRVMEERALRKSWWDPKLWRKQKAALRQFGSSLVPDFLKM